MAPRLGSESLPARDLLTVTFLVVVGVGVVGLGLEDIGVRVAVNIWSSPCLNKGTVRVTVAFQILVGTTASAVQTTSSSTALLGRTIARASKSPRRISMRLVPASFRVLWVCVEGGAWRESGRVGRERGAGAGGGGMSAPVGSLKYREIEGYHATA